MIKILLIGDSHIPDRAKAIPNEIKSSIQSYIDFNGYFDYVLCTGDIVSDKSVDSFFRSLVKKSLVTEEEVKNPHFFIVKGNMDFYIGQKNPKFEKFSPKEFPFFRIGLIHGHQVHPRGDLDQLMQWAHKLNVNILCSGHTHDDNVTIKGNNDGNILLLNPGSCVGAWSFIASGIPSFIVLEIGNQLNLGKNKIPITIYIFKSNEKVKSYRFKPKFDIPPEITIEKLEIIYDIINNRFSMML